jgi:hypothetical protein
MFRRCCHPQDANTNSVKMYSLTMIKHVKCADFSYNLQYFKCYYKMIV